MKLFNRKEKTIGGFPERQIKVSERLAALGDEFEQDSVALAALFKYLAVIHGAGDVRRMQTIAEIGNCLARLTLDRIDGNERSPTEMLEHFIQEGIELVSGSLFERNWLVAEATIRKIAFLDDLLNKTKNGEVLPKDSWPDIVEGA